MSKSNKCKFVLTKGAKKGQYCHKGATHGELCRQHTLAAIKAKNKVTRKQRMAEHTTIFKQKWCELQKRREEYENMIRQERLTYYRDKHASAAKIADDYNKSVIKDSAEC